MHASGTANIASEGFGSVVSDVDMASSKRVARPKPTSLRICLDLPPGSQNNLGGSELGI